jgi:hypothetical protein
VLADALNFANNDLGARWGGDAKQLGQGGHRLAYNVGVELAVNHDLGTDLVLLILLEEVGASPLKLRTDLEKKSQDRQVKNQWQSLHFTATCFYQTKPVLNAFCCNHYK